MESEIIDDETSAQVAEIMHELETDLPLKCKFAFHWQGSEEQADNVHLHMQVQALLMRRRHPWLNFNALESVVFHHDYAQALRDISETAGSPCTATSESSGVGIAMVVHLKDKCAVVLDAGVAFGIIDSDRARRDLCIDTVMHELCHVHDYCRMQTLLGHEFLVRQIEGLDHHVFSSAEAAWSEYFANRYSNSACSSLDMHPKYLAQVVPEIVAAIQEAILAYRTHAQLGELLPFCEKKIRFLFQSFGYAAGRLAAHQTSLDEIAPESAAALKKAGLYDVWNAAFCELNRLDECRDKWDSFDELKSLMKAVELTFIQFGLHYTEVDRRLHVDIPFTRATMPVGVPIVR